MNNNVSGYDPNTGQPITNNYNNDNNQPVKNKKKSIIKILVGIIVVIIILFIVIFFIGLSTSNKLVCKSNEGNITIMYNDSTIIGYAASGISYDMDQQKIIANQIGINNYVSQFKVWFETNTTGTCTVKEK